jgi:hypothetical protein
VFPAEETRSKALQISQIQSLSDEARYIVEECEQLPEEPDSDDGDARSDFSKAPNIDQVANSLSDFITELMQMDDLFSSPVLGENAVGKRSALSSLPSQGPSFYYANLISAKFPKAENELVDRLGKANWERFQHLQANLEIKIEQEAQLASRNKVRAWFWTDADLSLSEALARKEDDADLPDVDDALDSAVEVSVNPRSIFKDSGVGSSMTPRTSYAPTATSFFSSVTDGNGPRLPRPPQGALEGSPFICDICRKSVRVQSKREWK